ncbi:unnamed protein product [Prorocentrum cordatum]|uniref:NAD(P)-binding domain-containing protein n=1 Tax=Prorocentrum cordatum TaxID=2364126 RepID=A0ABN9V2V8_9DINO|nr:unnamed protein product [Polarella glacialis]
MRRTEGHLPEFINPKFADETRTAFKSPARLECMMQDYPKVLSSSARVGFTRYPLEFGYFPCKNDIATAARLSAAGVPPHGAASSEAAVYHANCTLLRLLGADVAPPECRTWRGGTQEVGPAVVLSPSFAPCFSELRLKLPAPGRVRISLRSNLLLDGDGIVVESLDLDGALTVKAAPGVQLHIRCASTVRNAGCEFVALTDEEQRGEAPEELRIRGYRLVRHEVKEVIVADPGLYELTDEGLARLDANGDTEAREQGAPRKAEPMFQRPCRLAAGRFHLGRAPLGPRALAALVAGASALLVAAAFANPGAPAPARSSLARRRSSTGSSELRGDEVVAVFGATGRTGRLVVDELLRAGCKVVAPVRNASKAAEVLTEDERLVILPSDDEAIRVACSQASAAVWCAEGEDVAAVGAALAEHGPREGGLPRVVMCSSAAVTRPTWSDARKQRMPGAADIPIVRLNPGDILGGKRKAEDLLRKSGASYAIVRPTGLKDGSTGSCGRSSLMMSASWT